jgi:hypothetical protein
MLRHRTPPAHENAAASDADRPAGPEGSAAATRRKKQPARRSDDTRITPSDAGRVQPRPPVVTAVTAEVGSDGDQSRPDEPEDSTAA